MKPVKERYTKGWRVEWQDENGIKQHSRTYHAIEAAHQYKALAEQQGLKAELRTIEGYERNK